MCDQVEPALHATCLPQAQNAENRKSSLDVQDRMQRASKCILSACLQGCFSCSTN